MVHFLPSPLYNLLFLYFITSTTTKITISFYEKPSCEPSSPTAGDAFKTDILTTVSGLCLSPPSGTFALEIEELDQGCTITAYLDSTCSMPTSSSLSPSSSDPQPCYHLGPSDIIGSFMPVCSSTNNNTSMTEDEDDTARASASPGLQSPPDNAAAAATGGQRYGWMVEMAIKALMAIGAVEVVWGF